MSTDLVKILHTPIAVRNGPT